VFSLKAPRYITETKRLAGVAKGVVGFIDGGLAELGDRLGPILWQFAPWRAFDADDIAAFMDLLPQELDGRALRHVLEVRHDSFRCHDYVALARAHGLVTVFTDSPDHPSFADATGDFIYARLMRSRSDIDTGYPPDELDTSGRSVAGPGLRAERRTIFPASTPMHPLERNPATCSSTSSAPRRNAIPPQRGH
jgi:uncharacterized protein YecE (DUF72 family)